MPLLAQQYQNQFDSLKAEHQTFLAKYGVVIPTESSQQALVLTYLYVHVGELVSLDEIRVFVRNYTHGSQDIQPRHLKYAGWNVLLSGKSGDILFLDTTYLDRKTHKEKTAKAGDRLPNGYIMLFNTKSPSADFQMLKRRGYIDRKDWESILASYEHKCACCKEKKSHLEKGHKDPRLGTTPDNIIPMCSDCNNWASNDFVFDDYGRIVQLASARLVLNSDLEIQVQILEKLRQNRDVNKSRI